MARPLDSQPNTVDPLPPCTSCGACCSTVYDDWTVADIQPQDAERLGPRRLKLYAVDTGRDEPSWATQAVERDGRIVCRALRGTVGRRVSCRVYDDRPDVCRAFPRGSKGCLSARREAGLA